MGGRVAISGSVAALAADETARSGEPFLLGCLFAARITYHSTHTHTRSAGGVRVGGQTATLAGNRVGWANAGIGGGPGIHPVGSARVCARQSDFVFSSWDGDMFAGELEARRDEFYEFGFREYIAGTSIQRRDRAGSSIISGRAGRDVRERRLLTLA